MSVPVELRRLDTVVRARGTAAYVLTVNDAGAPHVVHAEVVVDGACLVAAVGARTADNARGRPRVSLLYPSRDAADYSLIVDGLATVDVTADGARLSVSPTRAVLHRPVAAADPSASPCGSDCIPIALGSPTRAMPS